MKNYWPEIFYPKNIIDPQILINRKYLKRIYQQQIYLAKCWPSGNILTKELVSHDCTEWILCFTQTGLLDQLLKRALVWGGLKKLASLKAWKFETLLTHSLTFSPTRTGVKCRATSIAKKGLVWTLYGLWKKAFLWVGFEKKGTCMGGFWREKKALVRAGFDKKGHLLDGFWKKGHLYG